MIPNPTAIGLWVCEQVIIDARSGNPTLVSVHTGRQFDSFPTERIPFSVFASLTDGQGSGTIAVEVSRLETDDEPIQLFVESIDFRDRLTTVNVHFRIRTLSYPTPGNYLFVLKVGGESVADRRLRVYENGGAP